MAIRKQVLTAQVLLAAAYFAAGCSGEGATAMAVGDEPVDIETKADDLLLVGGKWPNGVVPVCWGSESVARADFAAKSKIIRETTVNSWGAVANIEFTGWGTCPSNTGGMVKVQLADDGSGWASVGYGGSSVTHDMHLGVLRSDFGGSLAPHEFGHILGFAHEQDRDDFDEADPCDGTDIGGGDPLGTPADHESIMASTGYCQNNPNLSTWDAVGARVAYGSRPDNFIRSTDTLYARKRSNGDYYRRNSSGTWSKIGAPGTEFVSVGTALYGLSPDLSGVYKYSGSGTSWSAVGGAAGRILRCGTKLCATNPDTKNLYQFNTTSWSQVGSAAAGYASTSSTLYALSLDHTKVLKYSGSGTTWTTIGNTAASAIYATSTDVFYTDAANGDIYKYSGSGTSWSKIGAPGRQFVGVGSTLYGLSPDRSGIWKYSGSGTAWTNVGGAADWMFGAESGSLYATNPSTKDVYRYTGSGTSWVKEGQP